MKSRRLYPILAIIGALFFALALIGSFFQSDEETIQDRESHINSKVRSLFLTLESTTKDTELIRMLSDEDMDFSHSLQEYFNNKLPLTPESSLYVWHQNDLVWWKNGVYQLYVESEPQKATASILERADHTYLKLTLPVRSVSASESAGLQPLSYLLVVPVDDLRTVPMPESEVDEAQEITISGLPSFLAQQADIVQFQFLITIYLFGYIFLLAYLFLIAHQLTRIYRSEIILIGLLFVLFLLRLVAWFYPASSVLAGEFFQPHFYGSASTGSMADWILNIITGFLYGLFFYVHMPVLSNEITHRYRRIFTFLSYLVLCLSTVFFSLFVRAIVENQYIHLDINIVENFSAGSILLLLATFLLLLSLFIVSIRLFLIVQSFEIPWLKRIGIFVPAMVVGLITLKWQGVEMNLGLWVISVFIIMLLIDLFLDSSMRDFTWVPVWLLILSLFSTVLFTHFYTIKHSERSVEALVDRITIPDEYLMTILQEQIDGQKLHEITRSDLERSINDILFSHPELQQRYQLDVTRIPAQLDYETYQDLRFHYQEDWPGRYLIPMGNGPQTLGLEIKEIDTELTYRGGRYSFHAPILFNTGDWTLYRNGVITNNESLFFPPQLDSLTEAPVQDSQFVRGNTIYTLVERGNQAGLGRQDFDGLLQPMSFFSFNFILSLLIFSLMLLFHRIIPFLPAELHQYFIENLSIRNKIQFSVLAILIAAFTMVGIVSANFYKRSYKKTLESTVKEFYQKVKRAGFQGEKIRSVFDGIPGRFILFDQDGRAIRNQSYPDHNYLPYPVVRKINLSPTLDQFDEIWPGALVLPFALDANETVFLVYPELTAVPDGFYRFINLLLNAFVFLLLISSALSFSISNTIISPLTELGNKLKEFSLGKRNEPIPWKQPDELGTLIQSYNDMVDKLEQSAELLAHSEREVAWREMAKQVAHEIKNPLTPMKLSIQHMEFRIREAEEEEAREIVQHVSKVLIEQIDNLSRIASEFSSFANLPRPEYEEIMLNDLVTSVYDLFRTRSNIKFNLYVPIDELIVQADRTHLIRVMNNLMKNAVQAIPPDREGHIVIRLKEQDGMAIVRVEDNGKGIEDDLHEKVFFPNFTTKSSGTGLGLAISKNIIETFDGSIYFIKNQPQGTIFIFELPLVSSLNATE